MSNHRKHRGGKDHFYRSGLLDGVRGYHRREDRHEWPRLASNEYTFGWCHGRGHIPHIPLHRRPA